MTVSLSRQQRRTMQRLAVEIEHVTAADRRFFERFPHRTYRMRRAARAEIQNLEAALGAVVFTAPGDAPFALIKNLAPGVRLRAFLPGPADEDGSDAPEPGLAVLWEHHAQRHPAVAQREAMMREAMSKSGGPLHQGGSL